MLLGDVDWNQLMALASLVTTTLGGVLIAYIALRQRGIDAKLEIARLEAAKRDRRRGRQIKKLATETEVQTDIIKEVRTQTNGMRKEAEERAHRDGKAAGVSEAAEVAKAVAVEVAKTVAKEIVPQPVMIANKEPIQVHDSGEQK